MTTTDTADESEFRAWARSIFCVVTLEEQAKAILSTPRSRPTNSVPREGGSPPSRISNEAYVRDYARRLFDPEYAAVEQELPEE